MNWTNYKGSTDTSHTYTSRFKLTIGNAIKFLMAIFWEYIFIFVLLILYCCTDIFIIFPTLRQGICNEQKNINKEY